MYQEIKGASPLLWLYHLHFLLFVFSFESTKIIAAFFKETTDPSSLRCLLYNLLITQQNGYSTYVQVARVQSYANHMQHAYRLSHATCFVPWYQGTAQLLSLTEVEVVFY